MSDVELFISAARPQAGPGPAGPVVRDLVVTAQEDSTVAELARALDDYLPGSAGASGAPVAGAAGTGGGEASGPGGGTAGDLVHLRAGGPDGRGGMPRPPGLWAGQLLLDPAALLAGGPVRDGALLGLGGPLDHDTLTGAGGDGEPGGVAELRVVAGRGAGAVHRLGLGSYTLGGPGCDIVLEGLEDPEGEGTGGQEAPGAAGTSASTPASPGAAGTSTGPGAPAAPGVPGVSGVPGAPGGEAGPEGRAVVAVVEVRPGGRVLLEAESWAASRRAPAPPVRHRPLPGPVVLASASADDGSGAGGAGGADGADASSRGGGGAGAARGPRAATRRGGRGRRGQGGWWRRRGRRRAGAGGGPGGQEREELDPEAPRSWVELDRRPLEGAGQVVWGEGVVLTVGQCLLTVGPVPPEDAVVSPSAGGVTVDFNRPPRLARPVRRSEFVLPRAPQAPRRQAFPFALMVSPMVMGGGMFLMTGRPYSLLFMVLSPLMMMANRLQGRTNSRRAYKDAMASYETQCQQVEAAAWQALVGERGGRRGDCPDAAELLVRATGPRSGLWERRPADEDWLVLRVGCADLPSDVVLEDPGRARHEEPLRWTAPDVPATLSLAQVGVAGVHGPGRYDTVAWLVGQAVVLHSPAELEVAVVVDPGLGRAGTQRWGWAAWLPHLRTGAGAGSARVRVGADEASVTRRLGELVDLVAARSAEAGPSSSGSGGGAGQGPQVLVVLDGAHALRQRPGVIQLLRAGPGVGVYCLCVEEGLSGLPQECAATVSTGAADWWAGAGGTGAFAGAGAGAGVAGAAGGRAGAVTGAGARTAAGAGAAGVGAGAAGGGWLVVSQAGQEVVERVLADRAAQGWCDRVGRALARVRDVSAQGQEAGVPVSSRLVEVLGLEGLTPGAVLEGWERGGRSTRAVVGEDAEGVFSVDVRADGPHALVAGTTGSGKSELLQTLIASLAVANTPEAMVFVLVDYKGGAAFKDCAGLPHTVGMVTDLDAHLTGRALESLGAELRRRERWLAGAGAKDIEDYTAATGPQGMEAGGSGPMPRLVIVIDEFAALAAELPGFVEGLVDVARRGRSLGVHLVLATQRPAGVVTAEIRSNTNLRIALRVTDEADSQDVVDSSVAAHIPPGVPGRAWARLGHAALRAFQASRVGGRPPGAGPRAGVGVGPLDLGLLAHPEPASLEDRDQEEDPGSASVPTDLATLVEAVGRAHALAGRPAPPSPWLPPLPGLVTLDQLGNPYDRVLAGQGGQGGADQGGPGGLGGVDPRAEGLLPPVVVGLGDLPAEQDQRPVVWDYSRSGHLGVAGAPRSGRSALLRVLAAGIARTASAEEVHLYGIDAGAGALLPLVGLPHTGAVVTRSQSDRVRRLLALLAGEVARRQQELARLGFASLAEQRAGVPEGERLPYLVVLVDRWDSFSAAYESVDGGAFLEQVEALAREGVAVGVRLAITGDRRIFHGRLGMALEDRVMLRMPEPEDYDAVGLRPREVPTSMPPGRGFRAAQTASAPQELQAALLPTSQDGQGGGQAEATTRQGQAGTTQVGAGSTGRAGPAGPQGEEGAGVDASGTAQAAALHATGAWARACWGAPPRHRRAGGVDELPVTISASDALALGPGLRLGEVALAVGGDTLGLLPVDLADAGNTVLVAGPRRSGRSTALLFAAQGALGTGLSVVLVLPRRSPLAALEGHPGVVGSLDLQALPEELDRLVGRRPDRTLVVVDDAEYMGGEHPLSQALDARVVAARDTPGGVLVAAGIDEIPSLFRGVVARAKKNRTTLLLAPRSAADASIVEARLPSSVGGPVPRGRGVMITSSGWSWAQVPHPDPAASSDLPPQADRAGQPDQHDQTGQPRQEDQDDGPDRAGQPGHEGVPAQAGLEGGPVVAGVRGRDR